MAALLLVAGEQAGAHPSRGIVVAGDGRVYFSDLERLWTISPNGRLELLRERRGGHNHELALDPGGHVIGEDSTYTPATGTYGGAIWRLSPDRRFRTIYGPTTRMGSGVGVIRDARGCSYRVDEVGRGGPVLVHRRCPDGTTARLAGSAADERRNRPMLLSNIAGAALDRRGNFFFRHGDTVRVIAANGARRIVASRLARENLGLAIERDGSILVAEAAARRVVRIAAGGRRSIAATSSRPWSPTGIAAARGSLYVLEASDYKRGTETRMRVRRIASDGVATTLATVSIPLP